MYLVMDLMGLDLPEVKELQSLYIYIKTLEIIENSTSKVTVTAVWMRNTNLNFGNFRKLNWNSIHKYLQNMVSNDKIRQFLTLNGHRRTF